MENESSQYTTRTNGNALYPTMADKARLFEANGIPAKPYARFYEDRYDSEVRQQAIKFVGDEDTAQRSVDIAIQYDLPIIKLAQVQDYDGDHPIGEMYWTLLFRWDHISR